MKWPMNQHPTVKGAIYSDSDPTINGKVHNGNGLRQTMRLSQRIRIVDATVTTTAKNTV